MRLQNKLITVALVLFAVTAVTFVYQLYNGNGRDDFTAGFTAEFLERPDGYRGLSRAYNLVFDPPPLQMDPGLMYRACAEGRVDVICGFATDGRISAYGLSVLEDDKKFFPPYYAAPVIREDTLERYPELRRVLDRLAGRISDNEMSKLNLHVDREENPRRARDVARDFLVKEGLIDAGAEPGSGSTGEITVGSKDFTEQLIMGEMMSILIECSTSIRVKKKLYLGGTMVCFNALRAGDLDIYPEYTGTGLVNILKDKAVSDPAESYKSVKRNFKKRYKLVWLKPFGFNNTYTLTVKKDFAVNYGIRDITGLAGYVRSKRSIVK